jgi:hypothetical protein
MTILMLLLLNFPLTSDETACLWELKSLKISNIQMIYLIVSLLIVQVAVFTRYTLHNTSDYMLQCTASHQKPLPVYVNLSTR